MPSILENLLESRDDAQGRLDLIVAGGRKRGKLLASEQRSFDHTVSEISDYDAEIERQTNAVKARTAQAEGRNRLGLGEGGTFRISDEEHTYRKDLQHERSYFRDLSLMAYPGATPEYFAAAERLARHGREVEVDIAEKPNSIQAKAYRQLMHRMGQSPEFRAGLNTSVGSGGTFLPPDYLLELYVKFPRQARVLADLVRKMNLPRGPMTIELPKITAGTATAAQNGQNTAAQEDGPDGRLRDRSGQHLRWRTDRLFAGDRAVGHSL